ncbi:hypothetical protein HZS_490 [Henneguya salminicola]|nr:hypothetical protein HZS_490 [Henneguya salminicola]
MFSSSNLNVFLEMYRGHARFCQSTKILERKQNISICGALFDDNRLFFCQILLPIQSWEKYIDIKKKKLCPASVIDYFYFTWYQFCHISLFTNRVPDLSQRSNEFT